MKTLQNLIPEIKNKITENINLAKLPLTKKHLLKPLQLSDVITVFVQQSKTIDKTKDLKSYLTRNRKRTVHLDIDEQLITSALQDLPQFAIDKWSQLSLLKYHVKLKRQDPKKDIAKYETNLLAVQKQFNLSLQKYKIQLSQGQQCLQDIKLKISTLLQKLKICRLSQKASAKQSFEYSRRILGKIRRCQNLSKTITMARSWNKSNVSRILSRNLSNLSGCSISELMKEIDDCIKEVRRQQDGKIESIQNLHTIIQERRTLIIEKVETGMSESIINYKDKQKCQLAYKQYNQLLGYLSNNNSQKIKEYHQLERNNLLILIQDNLDAIYWQALQKVSLHVVNNIQLLNQQAFLQLFQELYTSYSNYFTNWHKVTTYHINIDSPYKDNFIKLISELSELIIKKIFHVIKYSQKFFSLNFDLKIQLIFQIDKLVQLMEEWTGKRDSSIFQILSEKFRTEIQNFRKETNGLLKISFIDEFSDEGLLSKLVHKKEVQKINVLAHLNQNSTIKLQNRQKAREIVNSRLFNNNKKSKDINQDNPIDQRFSNTLSQLISYPFDLYLSKVFLKLIVQYCSREQILPFGHLQYIIEHFQFIILLIFKVCIHDEVKSQLIEAFSNQRYKTKIAQIEYSIQKNPLDQNHIPTITKIRQFYFFRKNYKELHEFLSQHVDNKFDNIVISGFLNINKAFQNAEQNIEILNNYHIKVSKLIQQLLMMSNWLIKNKHLFNEGQKLQKRIDILPIVLIQISCLYFEKPNLLLSKKYIDNVDPITRNLKFKVQKFNPETTNQFKQYKLKLLQIYRSSNLNLNTILKNKHLYQQLIHKQLQIFYQSLLTIYCKIDKINDNGRQVIRLDLLQMTRILTQIGFQPESQGRWVEKFIEISQERNYKQVIDKVEKMGLIYPLNIWKSNLLWITGDLSTKQKKDYMSNVLKIYINELKQSILQDD